MAFFDDVNTFYPELNVLLLMNTYLAFNLFEEHSTIDLQISKKQMSAFYPPTYFVKQNCIPGIQICTTYFAKKSRTS